MSLKIAKLLGVLLLIAPLAATEEEAAKPADPATSKWDARSRALIEAWEAKSYHLGRAGAKRASFKIAFEMELAGSPKPLTGSAHYLWDGKSGSLKWDNAQVAAVATQRGWTRKMFDAMFREDETKRALSGATVVAKEVEGGTRVEIEGASDGYSAMRFDAEGVLVRTELAQPDGMGGSVKVTLGWGYSTVEGNVLCDRWTVSLKVPGMGDLKDTTKVRYTKIGDFHVMESATSSGTMAGQPTAKRKVSFLDYKFNDDVKLKK